MRRHILALPILLAATSAAWADFDSALEAYRNGDFETALTEWGILARHGDPAAQTNLGQMFLAGEGVDKDREVALYWFDRAARRGFPEAQYRLGRLQQIDDPQEAVRHYREAAQQGHVHALNRLAAMYELGRGVAQDFAAAFRLRREAADHGNAVAQAMLGSMYSEGKGVPRDDREAVVWYRKAAEQGYYFAQARLGIMYRDGRGVPQDVVEAHKWLNLSSQAAPADLAGFYTKRRVGLERGMSPHEVIDALQLARGWKPSAAANFEAN